MEHVMSLLFFTLFLAAGGFVFRILLPIVTSPNFPAWLNRKLFALALWWNFVTRYGTELGGYVHDTGFTQWVPPTMVFGDTAAWSLGAGQVANSVVYKCDATDETATLFIPILAPSNSGVDSAGLPAKGALLKSIEVDYEIVTAACDTVTATLYKNKRGVDGADVVLSSITFTYDAAHDTDDERDDLDEHLMTITLDTPAYIENDEYYWLVIAFDKAATSTVEFLGAFVNYTFKA